MKRVYELEFIHHMAHVKTKKSYNSLSEDDKRQAILERPSVIGYIDNPSEELKFLAVKNLPIAISYINNPSEELIRLVLTKDPLVISLLPEQSIKFLKSILDDIDASVRGFKHLQNVYTKQYMRENNLDNYS